MSDFESKQQKMKRIVIFFHSLLFLRLKYNFFFGHFRSPVMSETSFSALTRRFPMTWEKPFDDISNLWPVIRSAGLGRLKKLPEFILQGYIPKILQIVKNALKTLFLLTQG